MLVIDEDKLLNLCTKHDINSKAKLALAAGVHRNSIMKWNTPHRLRQPINTKIINAIATYFIEKCGEELTPEDLVMFVEIPEKE